MIVCGDALTVLGGMKSESVNCCVTSPPYWGLRDYGVDGQLGLEKTPEEYVEKMTEIFREVRRALRGDGTLWLNLGDCYCSTSAGNPGCSGLPGRQGPSATHAQRRDTSKVPGLRQKDMVGIPWRVAFALQQDGWYLRCDIIWSKPNPMPESVRDRPTKAHEYMFLMSKNQRYYYDADAIKEPAQDWGERDRTNGKYHNPGTGLQPHSGLKGAPKQDMVGKNTYTGFNARYEGVENRNKRSVWTVPTQPFPDAHFAVFPPKLIEPCILAGCPEGGIVLDPFFGSGTTGLVAKNFARKFIGIELSMDYIKMAKKRLAQGVLF